MPSAQRVIVPGWEVPAPPPTLVAAPERSMDFALLHSHRLLKGVPAGVLEAMAEKCRRVNLARGEVLLRPGHTNQTLYFLLSGQLRVHLDSPDSDNSFPIEAGEIIGEMSIIENRLVSAWVVGEQPSILLAMPEKVFWDEFLLIPQATRNLLRMLIGWVRKTDSVLVKELERRVRYEHLQKELESAAKIQKSILPNVDPMFPNHPEVEAHATIKPAREVGGDFFDALAINDHTLCVAVGDVCGKGMAAALFMVRAITLLRICLLREQNLAAVLPAVNRLLCEANDECMYVTLAVAVLDTHRGTLTYLNGGHNPPLFSSGGNPFALWTPPQGTLVGVDPEASFSVTQRTLQPDDTLVLWTDGVSEAENELQEQFGIDRAARAMRPGSGVTEIVEDLERAVADFAGEAQQSDDITVLALRYRGPRNGSPVI